MRKIRSGGINNMHGLIGDYLREIDKIKKSKVSEEKKLSFISMCRKKIEDLSKKLQKGW